MSKVTITLDFETIPTTQDVIDYILDLIDSDDFDYEIEEAS